MYSSTIIAPKKTKIFVANFKLKNSCAANKMHPIDKNKISFKRKFFFYLKRQAKTL